MELKKIIFSLTCHESIDCLNDLIKNILYYTTDFDVLILISTTYSFNILLSKNQYEYENVKIITIHNDKMKIWGNINLFNQHILNIKYLIDNNIKYDYFWYISSNELFIKQITQKFLDENVIKINNQIKKTYRDTNYSLSLYPKHHYWIEQFKKDTHINDIFKNNDITMHIYQHEGLVLTQNIANEVLNKYYEFEIYNKSIFHDYVLEEIFVQSYLLSKYDIDQIDYFCFRYKMLSHFNILENNLIELYNVCYYHPFCLSIKPVNKNYHDNLRTLIRNKMINNNVLFFLNKNTLKKNVYYFSPNFNSKMIIKNDIIYFSKINKKKSIFSWIGFDMINSNGFYKLKFDIYANKDIDFDFIKMDNPKTLFKTKKIDKNIWINIEVDVHIKYDTPLILIFDDLNDTIDIQVKNIIIYMINDPTKIITLSDTNDEIIEKKLTVFSSGSCRTLYPLSKGIDVMNLLHVLFKNDLTGINFIGKLHDIKQHIQFIKYINDIIDVPDNILKKFLTGFNYDKWDNIRIFDDIKLLPQKKKILKENFNKTDIFIFEICSLKTYIYDDFYVQYEQFENNDVSECKMIIQTCDDLLDDLNNLLSLLPKNKKIIFQCHFRPNIIFDNENKKILNREIIHDTLIIFSKKYSNVYIYDPSIIIKNNLSYLSDQDHFSELGAIKSFEYIYNNYIRIKKRVSICLRGSISKYNTNFRLQNQLYNHGNYINIDAVKNSIFKHIIEPNEKYFDFDFFIHSWNEDLQDRLINLYNPKKYSFEDNNIYIDEIVNKINQKFEFGGVSQLLTIKKSIELKEEWERTNDLKYDIVMIYRPDVLLWKDINLDNYIINDNNIYVNAHVNGNGDFHFLMNNINSNKFKKIYDWININNFFVVHQSIKQYVINELNKNLLMDNIIPGLHQEVFRKLKNCINNKNIDASLLINYGITDDDINNLE